MEDFLAVDLVGFNEGESGAADGALVAEGSEEAAGEGGFAGAEFALEVDDAGGFDLGGELGGEGGHGGFVFYENFFIKINQLRDLFDVKNQCLARVYS